MEIPEIFIHKLADRLERSFASKLRVMMPAVILSYDDSSGLADVQPALRLRGASGVMTSPPLPGVPVFLPSEDYPVSAGSPCLLLFCDFCLDGFLASGQPVVPPFPRHHDLSDAIALVGWFPAFSRASASQDP